MTSGVTPKQADMWLGSAQVVERRVAADSIWVLLHCEGHRLFPDEMFADLFSERGRRSRRRLQPPRRRCQPRASRPPRPALTTHRMGDDLTPSRPRSTQHLNVHSASTAALAPQPRPATETNRNDPAYPNARPHPQPRSPDSHQPPCPRVRANLSGPGAASVERHRRGSSPPKVARPARRRGGSGP